MNYAERHSVTLTTNGSGAATEYTTVLSGRVHMISYVKTDFADGVDFTITLEATGESLWTDTNVNASEKVYPLVAGNLGATGAASVLTEVPIIAANDRVKIAVTSGGDTKTGTFIITIA